MMRRFCSKRPSLKFGPAVLLVLGVSVLFLLSSHAFVDASDAKVDEKNAENAEVKKEKDNLIDDSAMAARQLETMSQQAVKEAVEQPLV